MTPEEIILGGFYKFDAWVKWHIQRGYKAASGNYLIPWKGLKKRIEKRRRVFPRCGIARNFMKWISTTFVLYILLLFPCRADDFIGKKAPDLQITEIFNEDGRTTLDTHRGDIVVLNFFVTEYKKCREEIQTINKLQRKFREKGITLIGITKEEREKIERFSVHRIPLEFKVYTKITTVPEDYKVEYKADKIPICYVIGPDGMVLWKGLPDEISESKIHGYLQKRSQYFFNEFKGVSESIISKVVEGKIGFAYYMAMNAGHNEKNPKRKEILDKLIAFLGKNLASQLAQADKLFEDKDYLLAYNAYSLIKNNARNTEFADKASAKLKEFSKKEVQREFTNLKNLDAIAQKYLDGKSNQKKLLQGVEELRGFAKQKKYENTKAAAKAETIAKILETPWTEK